MKRWTGRSRLGRVDLYTRGTVYAIQWGAVGIGTLLLLTRPVRLDAPPALMAAAVLAAVVNGGLCHRFSGTAMTAYLTGDDVPLRAAAWPAAATGVLMALLLALAAVTDLTGLLPSMLGCALVPVLSGHSILVRPRVIALHQSVLIAVFAAAMAVTGHGGAATLVTTVTVGFITVWLAVSVRVSMWVLRVMWELDDARDVQARLAVAEERLRFGRDLHDVLGRNLAVIALKAELAAQLAGRGRPEAADQMTEVQRIAQESQREVREVVRGYREADLRAELEGARGVLAAAGIGCTVGRPAADIAALPPRVQSALGWVVREATTNILRHGDARHCAITVDATAEWVRLTVENDGAAPDRPHRGTPGSGLAGLRERLQAVGGTLEAGPAPQDRFRVTARVPHAGAGSGITTDEDLKESA
ncbi:sensor histidine kinase [Streptomyces sp. t39]|uniref:sensor histidine kinase n=1 Tax=Streptomyces sp. t39 TaxID=1828156 RepID=UPI0011CEC45D|nr:sensor histidine kinase [Streptomyces sp. t39]TXS55861.1 sensor histidine kinase [Streptomyces sp. t39]